MFAPEGDGCLQRAKREDAGRFSKEGKSLDDFWYFSSLKSTIREKVSSYFFESDRRTPQFQTQKSGTSSEVPLSFIKISLFFRGICVWLLPRVCLRARMPRFLRGSSIRKWQGYKQRVICPLLPPHRSSFRERKAQVRP